MLENIKSPAKTIILADRGYETYHVFAHIMAKGLAFVIRTKDISRKGGIAYGFRLPDRELDKDLEFFVTRSKEILSGIKKFPHGRYLISWIWKKTGNRQFVL